MDNKHFPTASLIRSVSLVLTIIVISASCSKRRSQDLQSEIKSLDRASVNKEVFTTDYVTFLRSTENLFSFLPGWTSETLSEYAICRVKSTISENKLDPLDQLESSKNADQEKPGILKRFSNALQKSSEVKLAAKIASDEEALIKARDIVFTNQSTEFDSDTSPLAGLSDRRGNKTKQVKDNLNVGFALLPLLHAVASEQISVFRELPLSRQSLYLCQLKNLEVTQRTRFLLTSKIFSVFSQQPLIRLTKLDEKLQFQVYLALISALGFQNTEGRFRKSLTKDVEALRAEEFKDLKVFAKRLSPESNEKLQSILNDIDLFYLSPYIFDPFLPYSSVKLEGETRRTITLETYSRPLERIAELMTSDAAVFLEHIVKLVVIYEERGEYSFGLELLLLEKEHGFTEKIESLESDKEGERYSLMREGHPYIDNTSLVKPYHMSERIKWAALCQDRKLKEILNELDKTCSDVYKKLGQIGSPAGGITQFTDTMWTQLLGSMESEARGGFAPNGLNRFDLLNSLLPEY